MEDYSLLAIIYNDTHSSGLILFFLKISTLEKIEENDYKCLAF